MLGMIAWRSAGPRPGAARRHVRRVPVGRARPGRRGDQRRRRRQRHRGEDRRGARRPRARPARARALRRTGSATPCNSTSGSRTRATTTWPRPPWRRRSRNGCPSRWALALAGLFVAVVIGIPLGILAGMRPGGVVDRLSVTGTSFGLAIPNFVLAFFLIQVFALSLGWLPSQGYTKFSEDPGAWFESIVLPAISLGVIAAASVARQTACRADRRVAVELRAHRVRGRHRHAARGREVRVQERGRSRP